MIPVFFQALLWVTLDHLGVVLVLAVCALMFVPSRYRWTLRSLAVLSVSCSLGMTGIWCNNVCIYANGGHMPVRGWSEQDWLVAHFFGDRIHLPMDSTSRLVVLADNFRLPNWLPAHTVASWGTFSVGDVLIWSNLWVSRWFVAVSLLFLLGAGIHHRRTKSREKLTGGLSFPTDHGPEP